MTLTIGIFQFYFKSAQKNKKQKKNRTCANMTVFVLIYKIVHYLNDLSDVFRDKDYPKMNDKQFQRKNVFDLISFRKC